MDNPSHLTIGYGEVGQAIHKVFGSHCVIPNMIILDKRAEKGV